MTTAATTSSDYASFCVCTRCFDRLGQDGDDRLTCRACAASYEIRNGILMLLPEYADDDRRLRYLANYQRVAQDDLVQPFEHDREGRHAVLLDFIGDVRGRRVLDIGSSDAGYLRALEGAELEVAFDLAYPFLEAIPASAGIVAVCGDAEELPFEPGSFDVIVLSDVLEHVLDPVRLILRIRQIATTRTRIIVHVPWEEDIRRYESSEYEFSHLRSFDDYSFGLLWREFQIVRERSTHPALEQPIVFQLRRFLPLRLYNLLTYSYFHGSLGNREYEWRARWIAALPKHERLLLRFYRPNFKLFELRTLESVPTEGGYTFRAPLPRSARALAARAPSAVKWLRGRRSST